MKMTCISLTTLLLLMVMVSPAYAHSHRYTYYTQQQVAGPLGANDVIVIAGDSVTAVGDQPGGWINLIREYCSVNYPQYNFTFIASGIPGNTSSDLAARFQSTVLNYHPNVVCIFIGLNDLRHRQNNVDWTTFYDNLAQMIQWSQAAGVRQVVLMCPLCYGERRQGQNPWDAHLNYLTQIIMQVGEVYKVPVIDSHDFWIGADFVYNHADAPSGVLTQEHPPTWGVHPAVGLGSEMLSGNWIKAFGM